MSVDRLLVVCLRSYWAPGLLILLTRAPSVAFTTVQPLLLRGLMDDAMLARNGRQCGRGPEPHRRDATRATAPGPRG